MQTHTRRFGLQSYSVPPKTTVYHALNVQQSSGLGVSHFQKEPVQEDLQEDSLGLMNPIVDYFFFGTMKTFLAIPLCLKVNI
ncbi:MAG: hypothetical protein HOI47_14470 [Candidatus Scalindua sp.]|nr:hypothetical protein [Candidatus Scalindua sp.]